MVYHALTDAGIPAICIDTRHAKAARDMAANKTDANDADGLAQLAEVGFFLEVRVKSYDSMLTRTLVAARTRLVTINGRRQRLAVSTITCSDKDLLSASVPMDWRQDVPAGT
ncbi:transposase-related protein (plasmid) [Rhizobium grahamii CCGE 502]|uniref:Transposase-related protein n=1 Tax=Rhizobium grahamii CCGE 502 TaxID=990285 RepID=S3I2Z8_9HYPH|nr:transposase-related protein [Rhizobium grahamii CCGE 502]